MPSREAARAPALGSVAGEAGRGMGPGAQDKTAYVPVLLLEQRGALAPLGPSHSPFQLLSGILWCWSGGLGGGREGSFTFKTVLKKLLQNLGPMDPLSSVLFVFGWG